MSATIRVTIVRILEALMRRSRLLTDRCARPSSPSSSDCASSDRAAAAAASARAARARRAGRTRASISTSATSASKSTRCGENIQKMNDMVFSFAEPGFQEFETSKYLTGILKQNGFTIQEEPRRHSDGVDGDAGAAASRSSRSAPTSTTFRRRRRSPASRGTSRSSKARPATAKGTTPACRCRSPRRSPSRR